MASTVWQLHDACKNVMQHGLGRVTALLEAHPDLVLQSSRAPGPCVLHTAVSARSLECVACLLAAGFRGQVGDRSLEVAASNGDCSIFEALLAAGEWKHQPRVFGRDGRPQPTPATIAAACSGSVPILQLCLARDANARATLAPYHTLLHATAAKGHVAATQCLLDAGGFDTHAKDMEAFTPTARACFASCDTLDVLLFSERDPERALAALYTLSEIDDSDAQHTYRRVVCSVCTFPPPNQLCAVIHVCAALRRVTSYFQRVVQHSSPIPGMIMSPIPPHDLDVLVGIARSTHMDDMHTGGVYVPDPLRASISCPRSSVVWAVQVDTCGMRSFGREWTSQKPEAISSSTTLRCWAYMRRLHALRHRSLLLAALRARRTTH